MRYFKLLKDTPEVKAGAIVSKNSNRAGDGYYSRTSDLIFDDSSVGVYYSAKTVESQPDWFVEVEPVTPKFRVKKVAKQ